MYVNPFELNSDYLSLFVSSVLESSSGYTTTGISTIENPESLPESFVFYRFLYPMGRWIEFCLFGDGFVLS